ncbi:MAG: class I SAM-dependent methyltransferase [Candidatus Cloacimonetes bacterium]|nr:class I SAM-dependent methyltransferase [Candidatus Cloacimonadota bacterium]MCF7814136.1 class I SAM-dependent methyltransferase [Candidatus Cloacimonadota bacterium]MCF7868715.1 class I SAM-dependent methyltransferase [Candidatus Cloacimonadota bacterium]MCF7884135.1 class I SAM-dependent methyltransferase [Candidatus Cloacimonadota bacterium]
MENLKKRLNTIQGGNVLDVATGSGQFIGTLNRLLENYAEITGIDTSNRALFAGKNEFKTNSKVNFKRMDAYKLRFEDTQFDTVAMSNSLHHFNDINDVLKEMDRVLKSGGYFLINEMCSDDDQNEAQKNHIMLHHWCAKVDSCFGTVHNSTYTSQQLEKLISKLDFSDLEAFEYSFPVEDPKDEKITGHYLNTIDPYIDPLKDKPEYKKLKEEAELLKERIRQFGFQPARSVFFIGKKK